jgi:hypothetical protein
MIVKVQLPLDDSPDAQMLIYSRNCTVYQFRPVTPDMRTALAATRRGYFQAETIDGFLVLGPRVADCPW